MSHSFWEKQSFYTEYDFIIIGAGIVGLSTALHLKKKYPDAEIAVLERGVVPSGASTKNAGFACFGSVTEIASDLQNSSAEEVFSLVQKRYEGLRLLLDTLGKDAITFEALGGHEIFLQGEEKSFQEASEYIPDLNRQLKNILPFSPVYTAIYGAENIFGLKGLSGMIQIQGEGQIHTGKMMRALWDKVLGMEVRVFTGVQVQSFTESGNLQHVHTADGAVFTTPQLIITVNGFAKQLLPELEVHPARAQVLITAPIPGLKIKGTFHYDAGYYYFRNVGDRVLLGGGRNLDFEGEQTFEFGNTDLILNSLKYLLTHTILPGTEYKIQDVWSGIMGVGEIKRPIVKRIRPGLTVGVRMGGMGVALGSLTGRELAELQG